MGDVRLFGHAKELKMYSTVTVIVGGYRRGRTSAVRVRVARLKGGMMISAPYYSMCSAVQVHNCSNRDWAIANHKLYIFLIVRVCVPRVRGCVCVRELKGWWKRV